MPDAAELSLRKIVVPIEDEAVAHEKENLAMQIYKNLTSGLPFKEAQTLFAKGESDNSAQIFKLQDLGPNIRPHIKNLKIGEFSPPIRVGMNYILFFVEDRRLVGSQEFRDQKTKLENELHGLEVIRQTNLWLQKERDRSKIVIIKD